MRQPTKIEPDTSVYGSASHDMVPILYRVFRVGIRASYRIFARVHVCDMESPEEMEPGTREARAMSILEKLKAFIRNRPPAPTPAPETQLNPVELSRIVGLIQAYVDQAAHRGVSGRLVAPELDRLVRTIRNANLRIAEPMTLQQKAVELDRLKGEFRRLYKEIQEEAAALAAADDPRRTEPRPW